MKGDPNALELCSKQKFGTLGQPNRPLKKFRTLYRHFGTKVFQYEIR